jgi:hypothetical protein
MIYPAKVTIATCLECPFIDDNQIDCELKDRELPKNKDKIPVWCPLPKVKDKEI